MKAISQNHRPCQASLRLLAFFHRLHSLWAVGGVGANWNIMDTRAQNWTARKMSDGWLRYWVEITSKVFKKEQLSTVFELHTEHFLGGGHLCSWLKSVTGKEGILHDPPETQLVGKRRPGNMQFLLSDSDLRAGKETRQKDARSSTYAAWLQHVNTKLCEFFELTKIGNVYLQSSPGSTI